MFKKQIALFVSIICFTSIFSQNNNANEETGVWYILGSNSKLSEKVSFQLQTQLRYFEFASELQQFKIRSSLRYRIMPGLSVAVGYAYFRNDFSYKSEVPPAFDEHRIVEDILLDHNIGKAKVLQRARLENRFVVQNGETEFLNWYRQEAKLVYPVTDRLAADIYNEIWLNVGDEPTFAQNWLGFGLAYTFTELVKSRIGYQRIHMDGPDFDRLIIALTFTPDFSKKSENATP